MNIDARLMYGVLIFVKVFYLAEVRSQNKRVPSGLCDLLQVTTLTTLAVMAMRYCTLWILLLLIPLVSSAQEIDYLHGSWLNLDLEMKWNDRMNIELSQSERFTDFIGALAVSNTTLQLSYDLNDWLKGIGGYRYTFRERKNRKFNRYQVALQARTKWNKLKLSWRTRLEYRKAIHRDNQTTRWRNKWTVGYKIKPFDINSKIFVEYWYTFDDPLADFSKYRIGGSLSKELVDNLDLKLGFNYDADINQDQLERERIVVLGLSYKFKRKKETK